jgi:HD-like signal output (HDOD) protein
MKPRSQLSAGEVDALWSSLERRLESVGLQTQPEVAAQVVELVNDPQSGLKDFAGALKADAALSGRLLRLANSAFFAQRSPVTNLERACVLLGLERLKAVSLGFYLARGASADPKAELTRRIWGQGVYRACLSAEIARAVCPMYAPEAFVVGLMMDAGTPILLEWMGEDARTILQSGEPPMRQFRMEFETLPFTHVDIVAGLARRWKLPAMLAKPLERHHTQPPLADKPDAAQWVHRIAYYVGALHLDDAGSPNEDAPAPTIGPRVLGLAGESLAAITARAGAEYEAMRDMFSELASNLGDMGTMNEVVQRQLISFMDQTLMSQIRQESRSWGEMFLVGGQRVEVQSDTPDLLTAYLTDSAGARIVSHVFRAGAERAADVLTALGVEDYQSGEVAELETYLKSLAA